MPRIDENAQVQCECGQLHNTSQLTQHHDGTEITCEKCGRTYTVAVLWQVHIIAGSGAFLKPPKSKRRS